jgi:hypothetical protein
MTFLSFFLLLSVDLDPGLRWNLLWKYAEEIGGDGLDM